MDTIQNSTIGDQIQPVQLPPQPAVDSVSIPNIPSIKLPEPLVTPAIEEQNVVNPTVKNALRDHYPTGEEILEKDILDIIGASDMSDSEKQEMYQKMNDTIANRVTARIVDSLNDDDVDTWIKLLDSNNQQEANTFMSDRGVDIAEIIAKEALLYKTQIVDLIYG